MSDAVTGTAAPRAPERNPLCEFSRDAPEECAFRHSLVWNFASVRSVGAEGRNLVPGETTNPHSRSGIIFEEHFAVLFGKSLF